ncbi:hypothetical protein [Kitasatospora sp. NE20-6]|uniref:hypothetical protein n=1 Tax=Kitasatospora sp. NE20-6 TaxID=2859066 RepID=UPI0038B24956
MRDEGHGGRRAALAELRRRLDDGRARAGLNMTEFAARAKLGRTTVQVAFQSGGPVPSADTVVALARVLRLPDGPLLELRREAAGESGPVPVRGEEPGRPIAEWDPYDLEVHPAGATVALNSPGRSERVLPGYVERAHDRALACAVREAAEGRSRMVVLVGSSSTGKTRACWEAVQPLAAEGWRLWHPYDPTRAEAALADLERVAPRTVVWLNEAQHYLGDPQAGERVAAALHALLTRPGCGPVLVLGTLWPEYAGRYTAPPDPDAPDPHSRVRELLAGRTLTVPGSFDQDALGAVEVLARGGDRVLAGALGRVRSHGRLAQDLAGAPELLRRYEDGSPAVRALLQAAMDARRLGVGLHLPQAFLTDAATDYLTDHDWDQLTDDWAEAAYADLARPVHGKQSPLRRTTLRPARRRPGVPAPAAPSNRAVGPVFRLADYLEQHGRTTRRLLCPPASFWHAAHTHLTRPDDLDNLADSAEARHRLQWAHHLRHRAADAGHATALTDLARMREEAGDLDGAETLYRRAADSGHTTALTDLARMREKAGDRDSAEALAHRAADAGHTNALAYLASMRERAGDLDGAEALYWQAADAGHTNALTDLTQIWERASDRDGAEALAHRITATRDPHVLAHLAEIREQAGDRDGAEALYRQAADAGHTISLTDLARMRELAGDRDSAEALAHRAADTGHTDALIVLASMRERAGDLDGAEALAHRAADPRVLAHLAEIREQAGDRNGAEALYQRAADTGHGPALTRLARMRELAGDHEGAETFYRRAADTGHTPALTRLARMRERAGDHEGAEALAHRAAATGHAPALIYLTEDRERAGDRDSAEALARRAADAGHANALIVLASMRERAGDRDSAEALAHRAADTGRTDALADLASIRKEAGDLDGAEALYRQAVEAGRTDALITLAQMREEAGDRDGADALYRQAADAGHLRSYRQRWLPYGLDPDGSPTPPWP